jgi:hypothetical protein
MVQYEDNNKPRFAKAENSKTYDLKIILTLTLPKVLLQKTKRLSFNPDGTPQIRAHKAQLMVLIKHLHV